MYYVFEPRKYDNSPALRIGCRVPPGDVNLAYIHVPLLDPEENVQIVDLSGSVADNLLFWPAGLAFADAAGLLRLGDSAVIPLQHFVLTDLFCGGYEPGRGLFYKYEFRHYNALGNSESVSIVDGDGRPLLPDEHYEVYLNPTGTPGVYDVALYTSFNTSARRTYKLRYNKVSGDTVIPAYEEILKASPVYTRVSLEEVLYALPENKVYALNRVPGGYHVYVPRRAETDPRSWQWFRWRLTGYDSSGNAYTTGWVSDCILPYDSLLEQERTDYNTNGAKKVTIQGKTVQEIIQMVVPLGFSGSIVDYAIESDNPAVTASIVSEFEPAAAETAATSPSWAVQDGFMLVDRPLEFTYSIFPKEAVNVREWAWEAFGTGYVNGEAWSTSVQGTATASYTESGWSVTLNPSILPSTPESAPPGLQGFNWQGLKWSEPDVLMWIDNLEVRSSIDALPYREVGHPVCFKATLRKSDGLRFLKDIESILVACGLVGVDPNSIYLHLKLGGLDGSGADPRVNLRWYVVDRFLVGRQDEGLVCLADLQPDGHVVAWTTFQELMAAPVFAIKPDEDLLDKARHVYIAGPKPADVLCDKWFLYVRDGAFEYKTVLPVGANYEACPELLPYGGSEVVMRYALPEYARQPFDPHMPYVSVYGGKLRYAGEHVLLSPHAPIVSVGRVMSGKRELTVVDMDPFKGLIYVRESVHPEDVVAADYTYKTLYYEYRGYYAFDRFFALDLNPSAGHTFTALVNGSSVLVPGDFPSAYAAYAGQVEEVPTWALLHLYLYLYLRPAAVFVDGEVIPGSVRHHTLFHTTESAYFDPSSPVYDPTAFLLARIYVRPNSSPSDVIVFDTRQRGGGLMEGYGDHNCWDIGMVDGIPYPNQGVVLVRLPKGILKQHGGRFTEEQVRKVVERYLAYGVYPVVEYF